MVTDKRKLAVLHRTLQFELSGIVEFGIVGGVCGLHAVGVFWTWSGVTSLEHQVGIAWVDFPSMPESCCLSSHVASWNCPGPRDHSWFESIPETFLPPLSQAKMYGRPRASGAFSCV
jgi:hypothetical protein